MLIGMRQSAWGDDKLPYIRSEDGLAAFNLPNAFTGLGQYETGWLGTVNITGSYRNGAWCGPFGMYVAVSYKPFRWYISRPASELVSLSSSSTQHAFFNGINDVSLSQMASVYSTDGATRGWLTRVDDITVGNGRESKLYCDGQLISTVTSDIVSSFANVTGLPVGIMNGIDPRSASDPTPSSVSPVKSGSKFYRFYIKKNGTLIHDCYPILDGTTPKIYDSVTGLTIAKYSGAVSYGKD